MADIAIVDPIAERVELPKCLKAVINMTSTTLDKLFISALKDAHQLDAFVEGSNDDAVENKIASLKSQIQTNQESFIKHFRLFLKRFLFSNEDFSYANNTIRCSKQKSEWDWEQLSLMSESQMNDMILVLSYAKKTRNRNARYLDCIAKRIAHLIPQTKASLSNNPIDPKNFLNAFASACNALHFSFSDKKLLFQLFDFKVCRKLNDLFRRINRKFIEHDVLPELENETNNNNLVYLNNACQKNIKMNRSLNNQEMLATHIISNLFRLHHEANFEKLKSRRFPVKISFQKLLSDQMQAFNKSFSSAFVSDRDAMILDRASELFDAIFDQKMISVPVKTQIARLQIIFVSIALKDPAAFSDTRHPIQILIQSILSIGVDWVDWNCNAHQDSKTLVSIIDCLAKDYFSNESILLESIEKLISINQKEEKLELIQQRVLQVEKAKKHLFTANLAVNNLMHELLKDKFFTDGIELFFDRAWRNFMTLVYLRKGGDSIEWRANITKIKQLIAPLNKRATSAACIGFNNNLEQFKEYINKVFNTLNICCELNHQIIRKFRPLEPKHFRSYENFFSSETVGPETQIRYKLSKFLLKLEPKTWIEYYDENRIKQRAQFLCHSEESSALLFIARHGCPVFSLPLATIAKLDRANEIQFIAADEVDASISCSAES